MEKLFPDPFLKKSKLSISLDQLSKVLHIFFIACQVEDYGNILKLSSRPLISTLYKAFLKTKRGLQLVYLPHFLHDFRRKTFLLLYFINWPNFIVWLLLLREVLTNMCIAIVSFRGCDVINFEINLIFLIKPYLSTWPKSQDKNLNILRTKRAFKVN